MTIWRMRIACWLPKATNTHSEYVILIAFPLQQWLQERASILRHTYNAYLYYIINQQDATLAVLCLLTTTSMLYMFRTPFASIIRSTINCNILAME